MHTDSFLLQFKNVDLHKETKSGGLKHLMDFSNFPDDHDLYSDQMKGYLGRLKSETADIPIVEAICLVLKAYSILLAGDTRKQYYKGCKSQSKEKFEA